MGFELFQKKAWSTGSKAAMVGLQKRGGLSLNAAAFALLTGKDPGDTGKAKAKPKAGDTVFVEFLFDRPQKTVAIRLAKDGLNSYVLRRQQVAASYVVEARAFFTFYGIPLGKTQRFTARLIKKNMIGFSLKEPARDSEDDGGSKKEPRANQNS